MSNWENTTKQLKEWVKTLIIAQYRGAKANQQMLDLLVDVIFANNLWQQIEENCLSLTNSTGKQLDTLGEWVGADRFTDYFEADQPYYAYPTYYQLQNDKTTIIQAPMSTYKNFNTLAGIFYCYYFNLTSHGQMYSVTDSLLLKLIELKIIQNSIYHTRGNIDQAIMNWADGNIWTEWSPMKLTYISKSQDYNKILSIAYQKGYLPRPTGCAVEMITYV